MTEFYERGSYDNLTFLLKLGAAVIVPLALIFAQPDLGTTLIIAGTVFFMLVLCGVSFKFILMLMAAVLVLGVAAVLIAPYRMARIFAVSDPWADPTATAIRRRSPSWRSRRAGCSAAAWATPR